MFTSKRKSAKYCSDACKIEYNRSGGSQHAVHYREAVYHLKMMLQAMELNPHWQADTSVIDLAHQLHSFASDLDSQYETGAAKFRGREMEIRPTEFNDRDKSAYAVHMLSFHDKYKCLACGQTVTGRRTNKDKCAFCGETRKWIKVSSIS